MAITSKACIKPVALYTNTPSNHPISNITAIKNNIVLIAAIFSRGEKFCAMSLKDGAMWIEVNFHPIAR